VTFGLQSYLSPLIVVYNIFLGAERWIVPIRIDLRQWNFEFDEVQALDSFMRLKLPEIVK
jgi:hypothetical protein